MPGGLVRNQEEDSDRESTDIHVAHNWCYLGTARSEEELASMLEGAPHGRFDHDHFGMLTRFIGGRAGAKIGAKIVELPPIARDEASLGDLCTAN